MPYSLVSAATLGFDLVRVPDGRAVADALLAGLAADPAALERLAAVHPAAGRDREQRATVAVRARKARELAAAVPHLRTAAGAPAGSDRAAVLVAQLERSTIGDAAALERVLRDDVLGPEHPAVALVDEQVRDAAADVLADAAVGSWAAGVLPPLVHRQLTGPFALATATGVPTTPELDLGPAAGELAGLLTGLRTLGPAGRARWLAAVDAVRHERRPWAAAMHEASWAAHVSGRTRTLATTQLLAVRAFLDAGFTAAEAAGGAWNAVAGCVQAVVMGDLLDASSAGVLAVHLP
ncbi:hypothetical protein SAMN06893096_105261 [Geodermatophilus pulveris]|uniref:Uncharacterized protein n=1 Tax=Geodermatophilus pulveris TaxID=1564159 RepID=A0A239FUK6_9ACTN|nr:hypothetical protein [Geodermatophilus pulveris]SNS60561.1 hypothetical protein SAMN06893096_105261 [Geodermatophilus pulveris]